MLEYRQYWYGPTSSYRWEWVNVYKTAKYNYYLFTYEESGYKKIARRISTGNDTVFLNLDFSINKWQASPYIRTYLNDGDKKIIPYASNETPEQIVSSSIFPTINKMIMVLG